MTSLRNRALAWAVFWASAVVVLGTYFLEGYLEQQTTTWFDDRLAVRHAEVIVALANSQDNPGQIAGALVDAAYAQPFSGQYWQVVSGDQILTSKSLTDQIIAAPDQMNREMRIDQVNGPAAQTMRVTSQRIALQGGRTWDVQVASSIAPLLRDREQLTKQLNVAFFSIGLFAVSGAMALVFATLRPMSKLREDVAHRWDAQSHMDAGHYPVEVRPLVEDINTLMSRNREIVDRGRRQAADLAHALKTPAAIMRNELEDLSARGIEARHAIAALDRLDAQLKRSLARMRSARSGAVDEVGADVAPQLRKMGRAFFGLARNVDKSLHVHVADGLQSSVDQHDLDEICGNLLDNALKWSRGRISFTAHADGDAVVLQIEDDGPGIPQDQRSAVLSGGVRLDQSTPGTGLGLSIASDLVVAYDGQIDIGTSRSLGGAHVTIRLPGRGLASAA